LMCVIVVSFAFLARCFAVLALSSLFRCAQKGALFKLALCGGGAHTRTHARTHAHTHTHSPGPDLHSVGADRLTAAADSGQVGRQTQFRRCNGALRGTRFPCLRSFQASAAVAVCRATTSLSTSVAIQQQQVTMSVDGEKPAPVSNKGKPAVAVLSTSLQRRRWVLEGHPTACLFPPWWRQLGVAASRSVLSCSNPPPGVGPPFS
jgi:hypothetical protein